MSYLNRAAEERYGVRAAEAMGRAVTELFTWRWLRPEDEANARTCLAEIGRWRGENLHVTHDGRDIPVESTVVTLRNERGEPAGLLATIRDISDHKLRERRMTEQLRLLDLSTDAIWMRDAQDRVTYWNSGAVAMYGYLPEEATGQVTHDLLRTEFIEPLPSIQAELQQQGRWEGELIHTRRDGGRIIVSSRWVADRDAQGRITAVLVTNSDITERKRAEEALRASEQRHRELAEALEVERGKLAAVIENLPVGVGITDLRGNTLSLNKAGIALHGFASGEQVLRELGQYGRAFELRQLDGRIIPLEQWPVSRALRGEYVHGYELSLLNRQTGQARIISYTAAPVRNPHGEPSLIVYVMQDLTEQRRAERALRESEERFRTMADAIPQLAWIATADGWVYWYNRRWYEYTGSTREQMEVWGWQSFHDPKVLPEVLERWNQSVRTGEPFEMVFPLRGADGVFRPFLTRGMPMRDRHGHVVQWFGTNTDITELRQAKEAAESANQAKDYFLAMLSHELRNPLNPVLIAAAMVQKHPQLPPELREDVETIRRNVELETRLIDDMLDATRITRGKLALQRRMVDARELLRYAVETCRAELAAKQLALELVLPPEPVQVHADPARLQQVFWNLIKNAAKFTPEQGRITITARMTEGGGLHAEVNDTGRGIEKQALERIFDAFEQGEPDVTRRYGGLGLGLAICKGLVGAHGGTICALSDGVGKGSTFVVELPPPQGLEQPAGRAAAENGRVEGVRCRILLVEDDPSTAELTARLLKGFGHEVTTASGMGDALTKFDQGPFDLVISDVGLPDGSGQDLIRQMSARRPAKAIALSGYGMESDIQQSRQAGFLEHLVKPIRPEQLRSAIERVWAKSEG